MKNQIYHFLLIIFISTSGLAQQATPPSGEILLQLKKLHVLGSAMHVAAHPDDENSLLLAYLAKDRLLETYYLSLTRGDGGQNLIGSEQSEYIGIIRTQELLAARRIDGAQQLFSRAYDFGFSKTREETLEFWGKDKILADVVYLIRKHRPDVLITRFPPDERAGHGHHNSSAYLALEAFKIAGDATKFPEQLSTVQPWQPLRIVWNSYSPGFQNNQPTDQGSFISIDLSGYNALWGKSYSEIAAESRSMHKTQGFGSAPSRTIRKDYLLHKDGEPAKEDLFDGVDISWNRVAGGAEVKRMIESTIETFQAENPAKSVPALLAIYKELEKLDGKNFYVKKKKEDVKTLIQQCLGLWIETTATEYSTTAGGNASLLVQAVNRTSTIPVILQKVSMPGLTFDSTLRARLDPFNGFKLPVQATIPKQVPVTQPYWLKNPIKDKIFQYEGQEYIGLPENTPTLQTSFTFLIDGQSLTYTYPWKFKYVDPSIGEIYRPFEVRPAVTVNLSEKVLVFPDQTPKPLSLLVKAHDIGLSGTLTFNLPTGWKAEPSEIAFSFQNKYEEKTFQINLLPPASNSSGKMTVVAKTNRGTFSNSLRTVAYSHIPTQSIFPPADAEIVRVNVRNLAKEIGYLAGAGDEVPAALVQLGCHVTFLGEAELSGDLSRFDAIIAGVRAYNTNERLAFYQNRLMDYVKNGGTFLIQYVTPRNGFLSNDLKVNQLGPYPFTISRDRVTDETAAMRFLTPEHLLLTKPNKISSEDFEGWIQERGLYFATDFAPQYIPLFASKDPGEEEKTGSLIYCSYGKGHFIYTGLSFFRELPAGVPGAYRLFANLISAGK
ncbi:PIG-L family deacetylase [Arundinibacter roseus]|nr:PIG-L family deacetylase [Arundinibacter roseus]